MLKEMPNNRGRNLVSPRSSPPKPPHPHSAAEHPRTTPPCNHLPPGTILVNTVGNHQLGTSNFWF